MAIIDDRSRELNCKMLFVGPPAVGVGTTFRELWALIPDAADSAVIPKPGDPPIYELRYRPRPAVRKQGLTLVLHLVGYEDAPRGQAFADLLQGADGLALVMDSAPKAMGGNQRAIQDVEASLGAQGRSFEQLAILLQYNKRDLPDALSIRQLEERLNAYRWPYVATSAHRAQGLQDMLERLTALMSKWVRVPAQSVPVAAPAPPPRPATPRGAQQPPPRQAKAIAPTSSMVDAFTRAEQKIFGRDQQAPGLGDEVDEDRTLLAGSGEPSPQAPSMGPSPSTSDQWADVPTQVTPEPSPAPRFAEGANGAVPTGPLGKPLQSDWSEDGPTQLDTSRSHAAALGVTPTSGQPAGQVPWETSGATASADPGPPQLSPAPPQPSAPQPLAPGPSEQPAAQQSEDPSAAPWEEGPPATPPDTAPDTPPAPAPAAPAAPTPQPSPAVSPAEGTRVVHVQVPELTGHTIEAVGVAELRDMVTVSVPLSTSVGQDERSVELRFEMGGTPPPSKAPDPPEQRGGAVVGLPLFVISVGVLGVLSAVLLVLYLMR